ncbi:F0F1 ATP synthase subunit delta, partial [Hoylesella marshii]|uniref:F0F1 ATP synthase subunit delta n=1 Tax=Hoylesella marshii TaxID=189722 RepID=UPI0028D38126
MDTGIISVRYARALLKCSIEAHVEEHVYHEMQLLASNYLEMPLLGQTIGNPMFAKSTKEAILLAACSEKVTDITKRFIALVLREGRENILPFMARSYIALYRQQRNITQGKLIT